MKIFPVVLSLTGIVFIYGCTGNKTGQDEVTESQESIQIPVEIPAAGSVLGDTINMSGKFVLFYGPEIDENSSDDLLSFKDITSSIIDSLNQTASIYAQFSSVNHIRIFSFNNSGSMIIVRTSFPEPAGMILSDGLQPPKIKKGYLKEDEIRSMMDAYFLQPS